MKYRGMKYECESGWPDDLERCCVYNGRKDSRLFVIRTSAFMCACSRGDASLWRNDGLFTEACVRNIHEVVKDVANG